MNTQDPRRASQIANLSAITTGNPPALSYRETDLLLAIRAYRDNPVHLRTALAAIIPAELGDIGSLVWSHIARVS
jgi:hypothetical protein